jgi:hypothetical protein
VGWNDATARSGRVEPAERRYSIVSAEHVRRARQVQQLLADADLDRIATVTRQRVQRVVPAGSVD